MEISSGSHPIQSCCLLVLILVNVNFLSLWKYQKTSGFLMFPWGIKKNTELEVRSMTHQICTNHGI